VNFVSLVQLERQYEEWMRDERELHFIVELVDSKEAIGTARLQRQDWGNVKTVDIGTYIGKKELWGKGLGRQITVALLEMSFTSSTLSAVERGASSTIIALTARWKPTGSKKGGAVRQTVFVNDRKWDSYHFDVLRDEYLNIRTNLLKQTLGDKAEEYIRKNGETVGWRESP
jgi:RimJ/RimL family protein N-acetyltransferase